MLEAAANFAGALGHRLLRLVAGLQTGAHALELLAVLVERAHGFAERLARLGVQGQALKLLAIALQRLEMFIQLADVAVVAAQQEILLPAPGFEQLGGQGVGQVGMVQQLDAGRVIGLANLLDGGLAQALGQ